MLGVLSAEDVFAAVEHAEHPTHLQLSPGPGWVAISAMPGVRCIIPATEKRQEQDAEAPSSQLVDTTIEGIPRLVQQFVHEQRVPQGAIAAVLQGDSRLAGLQAPPHIVASDCCHPPEPSQSASLSPSP